MSAFTAEELGKHASSLRALALDLLGDETLAEDAVQDACVAALVRPPGVPVAAAAWLRKVVRNCALDLGRSERRRRRRERSVARSEVSKEVDAAERLELQQEILAAVRSLDAPYRTAIWMRYYEHRTPGAIATALGDPVKTVKTRLWRALQLLRQRLDHRYGDRRAWLGALAPLAKWSGGAWGPGAAVAAGALWMQAKHLVVAAMLALALITGAVWVWSGESAPRVTNHALSEANAHGDPQPLADADQTRRVAAVDEGLSTSPAAGTSAYGSLAVRVRWHDGTAAPGIAIYCDVEGEPQLDRNELCVVSDQAGLARATHVHAGKVRLSSERGGRMEAEVAAVLQREVDFLLPVGIDVTGVVRDERQLAVTGAEVVLVSPRGGWLSGRTVALTDPTGAFAVRAVNPTWSFGARKAGYSPSALVDLDDVARPAGAISVQVQLRLTDPGACVVGTVVDETGAGIADATVALGKAMGAHFEIGLFRETWSPQVVTTAADGSFRCDGIEPGMQPMVAWAEGCPRAQESVQCVAGQTAMVTLMLVRGVTVTGIVRNQTGDVVAGALVKSLAPTASEDPIYLAMENGREKRPQTRSDANGRFTLHGIPPGTLRLVAAQPFGASWQYEAFTQVTLTGRAGEELTWNPVLTTGKKIRVCVVDAEGRPADFSDAFYAHAEEPAGLASVLVSAIPERQPAGVYWFVGCADVPYTIAGRLDTTDGPSRWLYRCHVMPGGPDVEIKLPPLPPPGEPGRVSGRIVDLGHRFAGKALSVALNTNASVRHLAVNDGSFVAENVPRGRYQIWAKAGDTTVLVGPWFELVAGQQLELGDLTTKPGARLRVALRAPAGADLGKPSASLGENFEWRYMRWDGAQLVADNVTAGKHRLTLRTPGWHAPPRDVDLIAGEDNVVTLDVVPGAHRKFDLVLPLPDQWQRCQIVLRDAAGTIVSECPEPTPGGVGLSPWGWHAEQPLGQFTLEATLDGQLHSWPVDLRDPATGDRRLRFSLR